MRREGAMTLSAADAPQPIWVHNPKRINKDGQDAQDSFKSILILRILSIPVNSLRRTF